MPIIPGACVGEPLARHRAEAERIVEFAVANSPGSEVTTESAKLEHQPAIEIKPENLGIRFTRRVRHDSLIQDQYNMLIIVSEPRNRCVELLCHLANAGLQT